MDAWVTDMQQPFTVPGRKARPTPREVEIEADAFAALYAQVTSQ